jgi:hypothetical protein
VTDEQREHLCALLLRLREDNKRRAYRDPHGSVPYLGVDDYLVEIAWHLGLSLRGDGTLATFLHERYGDSILGTVAHDAQYDDFKGVQRIRGLKETT